MDWKCCWNCCRSVADIAGGGGDPLLPFGEGVGRIRPRISSFARRYLGRRRLGKPYLVICCIVSEGVGVNESTAVDDSYISWLGAVYQIGCSAIT